MEMVSQKKLFFFRSSAKKRIFFPVGCDPMVVVTHLLVVTHLSVVTNL